MDLVSMEDRILALSLSYDTNYKITDLSKIAEYYSISLTKLNDIEISNANAKNKKKYVKKKKDELIKKRNNRFQSKRYKLRNGLQPIASVKIPRKRKA